MAVGELGSGVTVGVIGLGLMGKPMAMNLVRAGFEVLVASRSDGPVEELVTHGASSLHPTEIARRADVVITVLPTPTVTREVLLGEDGVIASMRPGAIVIDMGTETPDLAREIHVLAGERGILALDAPVSGGDIGARAGTLSIMVGGEQPVFEAALPVLRALGSSVRLVGGPGSGQCVKAVNQILVAGALATVSEGMALLERSGVDVDEAIAALSGGRAGSAILTAKASQMLNREYAPGFKVELHLKDLGIVAEFARKAGVALPFTALAQQMLLSVEASGGGSLDHSAMVEAIRALSRLDVNQG